MLLGVLLIWKILLFVDITGVEYGESLVIFISTLIILIIYTGINLSKLRKKDLLGLIIYGLLSLIMFVDTMYFSYFNTLPPISMVGQVYLLGPVGDSILDLLSLKKLAFLLDLPLVLLYFQKGLGFKGEKSFSKYLRLGLPLGLGLILAFSLTLAHARDGILPLTNQEFFLYHINDIRLTLANKNIGGKEVILSQSDLEDLMEEEAIEEKRYFGLGKNKNLIVIQVEALQNFVIDLFYEGQEVTPNMNKLIRDRASLYFTNYYQQIGRGNTSDAEFVSNNSLYPSMEEPTYSQYEENTFYGLPWILRENGYSAWVFHGYNKDFWNRDRAYVGQGFQRFISEEDYELTETIGFGITDREFFKQSMAYLKELRDMDKPFYAFMITLTSHTPFKMPKNYQNLQIRSDHEGTILGDYLQAIHYTDGALGEFIEDLKREGLYQDSIIALYGDHYAITAYNPNGVGLMTELLNRDYHIDEMFNIPLIIHLAGENVNDRVAKIGSQLDFAPTILNILGYENEKGLMFGKDLLNYQGDNLVAAQTYVLKGSFISEDNLFTMSNDGLFRNSLALNRHTRERLDVEDFKEKYEKVVEEINKSDHILKNDLIKEIVEGKEDLQIDYDKVQKLPIESHIAKCRQEPIRELEESYESGKRLASVELYWGEGGQIMVRDNASMASLASWLEDHQDMYIILSTKEDNIDILLDVKDKYPNLINRLAVKLDKFNQYNKLSNKAFKYLILSPPLDIYREEDIIDFVNRYSLAGLILNSKNAATSLINKLGKIKIPIYLKDENNYKLIS